MIRGNDFILNPDKLQEEFQLVEVSDWIDFSTKEKIRILLYSSSSKIKV